MKALVCITLILVCGMFAHAEDQKPSKEMQKILDLRFSAPSWVGVRGLKKLHYEDLQEFNKLTKFESIGCRAPWKVLT